MRTRADVRTYGRIGRAWRALLARSRHCPLRHLRDPAGPALGTFLDGPTGRFGVAVVRAATVRGTSGRSGPGLN